MENIEALADLSWMGTETPTQQETQAIEVDESEVPALELEEEDNGEEDESMEIRKPIERADRNLTVKKIVSLFDEGKLRFDLAIQRDLVWDDIKKAKLVDSMIVELPITSVWAWDKDRSGTLFVLDGKQRLTTMIAFVKNEIKIRKNTTPVLGIDISGMYFDEMNEDFKNAVLNTIISFNCLMETDEGIIAEIMRRLNTQVPLSKFDILKTEMGEELMGYIKNMSMHPFFIEKVKVACPKITGSRREELVMRIMMLNEGENDFTSEGVKDYMVATRDSGIKDWVDEKVRYQLDRLTELDIPVKNIKKIFKAGNVPIITQMVPETNWDSDKFAEHLINWSENITTEYKEACRVHTDQASQVGIKLSEMRRFFEGLGYTYEV